MRGTIRSFNVEPSYHSAYPVINSYSVPYSIQQGKVAIVNRCSLFQTNSLNNQKINKEIKREFLQIVKVRITYLVYRRPLDRPDLQ